MAASLLCGSASVAATLPVPCAVGSCAPAGKNPTPGFTAPTGFVTSGQATATQSGNTLTVNQTSSQAILNWASFNISSDGKVVFQQPTTTSIALNKIFQQSPSSIFGQLTANGQIYLINPNGIVFGATASVNTAALVASSLGLTSGDSELSSGIAAQPALPNGKPQSSFASDGRIYVLDSSGNPVMDAQGNPQTVQIVVQPGAQLTAADGGRVMLLGQNVTNGGTITAPDGQIVLAAGQSVYLQASTDPSMRGLVVEVSGNTPATTTGGVTTPATGTTNNQTTGVLTAERGNVSLLGLAVNQSGRISASTAVSANGSVYLEAGGFTGSGCAAGETICQNQGGTLTVAPTSEIDLLPDSSQGGTATVGQAQIQSQIKAIGQEVDIEGGAITAPGGNLQVLAAANPDVGVQTVGNTAAQIQVGAGTNINLAGSDAVLPVSDNLVSIQLRSNELADDPDQHNGALEAQTVIVDLRDGRPPIISDTSWQSVLAGVTENILQRTAVGGTASFQSEGSIVVNNGSTINVSGGAWNYLPGVTQTSMLIGTNGQAYNISTADPTLSYTGVMNPTFTTSYNGFGVQITQATPGLGYTESGYTEGFSAGKVSFAAPAMALQGSLVGTAVNGAYQMSAAQIPAESLMGYLVSNSLIPGNGIATGGTLNIGTASGPSTTNNLPEFLAPAITFTNSVSPVIVAVGTPLPPQTMELSPSYITSGGFAQTNIYSDGTVTLPAGLPLNLGAGGSLVVDAPRIVVDSSIQTLSGTIDLQAVQTTNFTGTGLPRLGINIGNGVTLDVRGQWTNDSPDAPATAVAPAYQNGGMIDLSLGSAKLEPLFGAGGQLVLGNNVSLEASGGAWVQANNKVTGGTGGSITLGAAPYQSALQIGSNVSLDAFGVEGAQGGSFSLAAPRILVDAGSGTWATAQQVDDLLKPGGAFEIGAPLFSQYGFSSVTLTATAPILPPATSGSGAGSAAVSSVLPNNDVLTVAAGTSIDAVAQSLELNPGYLTRASGGDVLGFTTRELLPASQQSWTSVSLQAITAASSPHGVTSGDLDVQAGTSIETTANLGSAINLVGDGSIFIDGTLRAPGGTITAQIALPGTQTDPGYLPDQTLELGSQGILDVSGTAVLTPNILNLPLGTVLAGGTIDLVTDRGDIVADPGSLINIQGGSALLDVQNLGGAGGYQRGTVGSDGGTLDIRSLSSISLLGNIQAAGGASSTGKLQGGTLELTLDPTTFGSVSNSIVPENPIPLSPGTIELVSSTAGSTPTASYGNLALLGVAQLETWGIDDIQLNSDNTIELASNTALTMGREILLNAPNISVSYGTSAALNAPFIEITDTLTAPARITPLPGTGSLSLTAQQIVLAGNITLQGAANTTLTSAGDVEFEPWGTSTSEGTNPELTGSLTFSGNLTIDAARVYPATATIFTIEDTGSNGTVTIGQTSASPGTPLSAAGSLTIDAANIVSSGTILAPFGTIKLAATNSLSLLDGSVTSVSADGATIPYGQTTLSGAQWVYDTTLPVSGVPTREVQLTAPNVSFASGATIDVSGGGDLSAYEWVPGTGGFTEALSPTNAATSGLYAILPSTRGQYASFDVQEFANSNVGPGGAQYLNSVYLSGVPGLPAGYYPLLPARDALLSGALLIQIEPGYQSLTTGKLGTLADGTPVFAGALSFGNTGLQSSSLYTGFAIRSSSYLNNLDTYTISTASSYFANAAAASGATNVVLPADAGTLLIAAGSSLNALGKVNSAAGAGGTGATIELSANDLTVTASSATNTGASGVTIGASVLSSWNAGDLILGGELASDGSGLIVTANNVTIGAGAQFNAGQVVAVANNTIEVQAGANVASNSGAGGPVPATLPSQSALTLLHSDSTSQNPDPDYTAALLAVSDSSLPIVARGSIAPYVPGTGSGSTGSSSSGTTTPSVGTIQIDSGASLSTRGAVALDAPGGISVLGTINAPGASWSLASSSIAFVGTGGSSSDTLVINPALLAQMQSAGALQLTAIGSIDLLTNVNLGASSATSAPAFSTLGLTAASINNTAGGNSVFGGQTLMLQGSANSTSSSASSTSTAPTAGTGTLTFVAKTVDIGTAPVVDSSSSSASTSSATPPPATALVINGDSQTTFQASGAFVGQGTTTLGISGNTTIAATELTSTSQSDVSINVPDGSINIMQSGVADKPSALTASLGGQLSLSANAIQDSGSIIVPGGRISLVAAPDPNAPNNGGSAAPPSNITLSSSADIDAGGITVSAGNETVGAAGGIVNISASGDLTLPAGSNINVSGTGDAPAGFLSLTAGGTAALGGTLSGNAATGATGGNFWLDAGQLVGGLPALTGTLTTGGFTNSIDIRVRSGDLDSAAGTNLTANQIVLTADTGVIDIAGTLDAPSAGLRGSIGLFAGNGLTLESTAQLIANSTGTGDNSAAVGGEIELSTVNNYITLDSGSVISASGATASAGGTLLLRAPAVMSDGDVQIGKINSTVVGVAQEIIEPVLPTVVSSGDLGQDMNQIESSVSSFLAASQASGLIAQRFPSSSTTSVLLEPGVVVTSTGSISNNESIDLYALQTGGQLGAPIDLTVRAAGSIYLWQSISDGISGTTLSSTASSSLRFVAGADLSSANPLATMAGSNQSLTLESGTQIRTGTGDIDLVASGNITIDQNASAYTLGEAAAPNVSVRLGSLVPIVFPKGGGNVIVNAGGSVIGSDLSNTGSPSDWQARSSASTADGQLGFYGINVSAYAQNPFSVATLGGGDVSITAAQDVVDVSATAADTLSLSGTTQTHTASGGMTVVAGRDITTGQFFVADGIGTFNAGRSIASTSGLASDPLGSIFELDDAQISAWAEGNITVSGVFNPTLMPQPNAGSGAVGSAFYVTYSAESAFNVQSSSGNVTVNNNIEGDAAPVLGLTQAESEALGFYPGSLSLRSLTQDILLPGSPITLSPSTSGQLNLFAGQDIVETSSQAGGIYMSDAPVNTLPTVTAAPATSGADVLDPFVNANGSISPFDFSGNLHQSDSTPASIVAGRDIDTLTLSIPKAADVVAGRDIVNLVYAGENLNSNDVTFISAGRDFIDPVAVDQLSGLVIPSNATVNVGGVGQLDVLAGRNINLGLSAGVTTSGNLLNGNLPGGSGASITMLAGLGQQPDDSGFLSTIIETSATYQQELVQYVESATGQSGLSTKQADTQFSSLNQSAQQAFVDNVFFNELNLSGIESQQRGGNYSRGYAAIDALFPGSRAAAANGTTPPYSGDLDLTYSQIYTLAGGDITLLVPGGGMNVGLASPPAGAAAKAPSQLGIVTEGSGNINIYAQNDVNVSSSRIFTLGGGNLLIWSNLGSIDAGNGAKTSLSLPPPTFVTDKFGNETLDYGAAVSGSGIRTIQTGPGEPAGNVNLIAPVGSVNAGDAGIGAAGNINIAAVTVTGASNINFGGTATGVPAAVGNIAASVSGAATSGTAATNAAAEIAASAANTQAAPVTQAAISWLDVFVTGLGDENCKPEDEECLKRQKSKE
jgi:filamentous hemagglutinin